MNLLQDLWMKAQLYLLTCLVVLAVCIIIDILAGKVSDLIDKERKK